MKAVPAVALSAGSALLYMLATTPESRAEWFYVTQGATAAILFALAARHTASTVAAMALWWGAFEESQVAVCGIGSAHIEVPLGSTLCLERFGMFPYGIACVVGIYYLWANHVRSSNAGSGR